MAFPQNRMRRLRRTPALRRLVRETALSVDDVIYPLFVREGTGEKRPIESLPDCYQMSVDVLVEEARQVESLGVPAILLFGIPERKDAVGSQAYAADGIVQRAVSAIKESTAELLVITDVCLCEYTDHGHCGALEGQSVENDRTLDLLARSALSHARAGADMVAPSDMMDGRVGRIRAALDGEGFSDTPILAYSAKFASSFYGPFREAVGSVPQFGDRKSYQMDPANADEALREVALDVEEGADIVMVKPALAYLDLIRAVKERFGLPVAAYSVSGEYAMVQAAARHGWLDERAVALEILTSIKRAGADIIITYWAKALPGWLQERGA